MLHFLKISQLLAVGCWHLFCLTSRRARETSSHCLSSACTETEYVIWKKWLLCIIFVLGREHTASGQKRESLRSVQQLIWHDSLLAPSHCHTPPTIHLLLTQLSLFPAFQMLHFLHKYLQLSLMPINEEAFKDLEQDFRSSWGAEILSYQIQIK